MHYNETNELAIENAMPTNSYILNSIMATQEYTKGGTNELSKCVDFFVNIEGDENEKLSLCKGNSSLLQEMYEAGLDFELNITDTFIQENILIFNPTIPYFEFTIDGKNTTTNKDIWYEIVLDLGDAVAGKTTRIKDNFLAFTLKRQKDDNTWETVIDSQTFNEISNTRLWIETIPATTTEEIKHTYRLYMWIADNINICGGDLSSDCDYTLDNWKDVFASIKVGSNGDFNKKEISFLKDNILKVQSLRPNAFLTDTDGTIYLSGKNTKDQVATNENAETIDFNYVLYSGILWRITAINPDGTIKMITDGPFFDASYGPDVNFYDISKKDDASYTGSNIYQQLNEFFLKTLNNYKNIIVEDSTWNITNSNAGSRDEISAKLPKTTLINNSTIGKNTPVGLLNSYEYYLSYKNTGGYAAGYLKNGNDWWLLNPYDANFVWHITNSGFYSFNTPSYNYGVCPVINLKANTFITNGDGTKNNPFEIALKS